MVVDFQKMKKELKKSKEKKRKKGKKSFFKGKIVSKPTAKLPSTDPKKFITRGLGNQGLVREGRKGYFREEYMEETKWLS